MTPADERRAAVVLVHLLRDDYRAAAMVEHDGPPVGLLALFKAVTAVFPESWLDPEAVTARAEEHVRLLLECEHGLLDDGDDQCSASTG